MTMNPGSANYRRVRLLGSGGHGAVWLAEQVSLKRQVALKVLHTSYREDAELVARFEIEARVTAALAHPHVVRVLDHGVEDGAPWIAYEYLQGRTLLALLGDGEALEWRRACEVLRQVASAVEAAHAIGVLHRDLKAGNVMEAEAGTWKVTDFGIAKWARPGAQLTRTGDVVGTPFYMAPELWERAADERTDVYGLGLMALEVLVGEVPFPGKGARELFEFHRSWKPAVSAFQAGVPEALDELVRSATAPDPEARPATARAFREGLERVLREPAEPVTRRESRPPNSGGARRHPASSTQTLAGAESAALSTGPRRMLALATGVLLALAALTRVGLHRAAPAVDGSPSPEVAAGSAGAGDLASLERAVGDLERRFVTRGRVYVEIGQLERGGLGQVDLAGAARLGEGALPEERVDLAALAPLDAALDDALARAPGDARALLLRARVRALLFLDWERATYLRHDAACIRDARASDGALELLDFAQRLDRPWCPADGVARVRVALEAGVAVVGAAASGALPRDADLGGELLLLKEVAGHLRNIRWQGSGARDVERVAAQQLAALDALKGPLAVDLAALTRALWLNGWDSRAASADAALCTAAREGLARARVQLPRLGLEAQLPVARAR